MSSINNFDFPFPPYDIQQNFMECLYQTLENGQLGIFESPTGTGKSLSIICGSIRWLLDHEKQKKKLLEEKILKLKEHKFYEDSTDWITEQAKVIQNNRERDKLQLELDTILKYDEKIANLKKNKKFESKKKKENVEGKLFSNLVTEIEAGKIDDEDEEIILDNEPFISKIELHCSDNEDEHFEYKPTKIYFCSRTHSQLSQFVGEVLKTSFKNDIRLTTLASRQTYCINEVVKKLKNISLINDRCLDLQQKKNSKSTLSTKDGKCVKKQKTPSGCPYMNQNSIENVKNEALTDIYDVEQMISVGRELKACPYYSSRATSTDAQIIVLPYHILLHKPTRKATGISLKNNIVIIDEAHNLLDIIGHIHSCEITGYQLTHAYSQIIQYRNKYLNKFSAKNLLRLNQIVFVIGRLIKFLGGKPGNHYAEQIHIVEEAKIIKLEDFLFETEINSINLFELLEFCENRKISQKLHSFSNKYQPTVVIKPAEKKLPQNSVSEFLKQLSKETKQENLTDNNEEKPEYIASNPILNILQFIENLTNAYGDGRILYSKQKTVGKSSFKYLLLNPAAFFEDIVKEARSVIVAGGTMQPMSEFRDQLFKAAGAHENRIIEFSCGHIVPSENILPMIISTGPSEKIFNFSYEFRDNFDILNELGRLLLNVVNIVPGGIVCFFPSYECEKNIFNYFSKNLILQKLEKKKKIFREPKLTSDVENILEKYSLVIRNTRGEKDGNCTGAILFSVVGGKLSEGLNFNDDLGRCIIVIGMPYPNLKSLELKEKMEYLNKHINNTAGQLHYENLCMKAVNQCIGRAIRHRNDYAVVLLLDERYCRPKIQKILPKWIQKSLRVENKFGAVMGLLAKFFSSKRNGK